MKITLVCHDIPYPAIHGGRVDMWRRIKAFSQLGIDLQVICWVNQTPKAEDIAQINRYVQHLCLITYQKSIFSTVSQICNLLKFPLEVTSRIVTSSKLKSLVTEVGLFSPDVIWLDGIHGGEVALELSQRLNIPLIYRSHNIEYLYYQRLFASATGFAKMKRFLSQNHMEQYEKHILTKSTLFYDISPEDLRFWQSQGFTNGRYLSPIVEFDIHSDNNDTNTERKNPEYDIVFLGNLYSNNNVAGIIWFLTEVTPILLAKLPNTKILIAGANPVKKIKKLCQQTGVTLKSNPTSSTEIYNSGRVFINPVLTGSGVSIKSVEMLAFNKPIVSTLQGVAGLPEVVKEYFNIAEDAQSFAEQIIYLLSQTSKIYFDTSLLKSFFGIQNIENILKEIDFFIKPEKAQVSNVLSDFKSAFMR
ncbi:MAG: glycosyltransferase family 4 protein [Calothrix sp. C42_A2020_038]|nr:glycosyltransferase family 4 protein [Calothrix sp. C42_A2020_038]